MAYDEATLTDHIFWCIFDWIGDQGRNQTREEVRSKLSKDPNFANCDPEMAERCFAMAEAEWQEIDDWVDKEMAAMPSIEEGVSAFMEWLEAPPQKPLIH
jgi:hypothetical protein